MTYNRKIFFDGFRRDIDSSIEQKQVDGLEFLLGKMESDPRWKDVRHVAYALATAGHETAWSFQPVEEGYYLGSAAKVKRFQKTLRYFPYFGRGYVQLTWAKNYEHASKKLGVDFNKHPELVMQPENAYEILTAGMHEGWFTGKKLSDYIYGSTADYKNARRIINGVDKAALIASYAKAFEKILRNSAAVPSSVPSDTQTAENNVVGIAPSPAVNTAQTEQPPNEPNLISTPTIVVDVPQVSAEKQPAEDTLTAIGNKAAAFWTTTSTVAIGIGTWVSGMSIYIVLSLAAAAVALGVAYMIINALRNNAKEKRDLAERQSREQRAHELQKLTLESAMTPHLQTVRIVPTPIENSTPSDAS